MKERDFSIQESIKNDLKSKIVLLSVPRQVGKTTLSKNLITPYVYINYDTNIIEFFPTQN
jgi:predicted AAA+ superfamily ATPase